MNMAVPKEGLLEILTSVTDLEGLNGVGRRLLSMGSSVSLQKEIRDSGVLMFSEDLWTSDMLQECTQSATAVKAALAEVATEGPARKMLHQLQLLQKCCPAVSSMIDVLLRKTLC